MEFNAEKIALGVFVFSILAVLILTPFTFLGNNITGNVVQDQETNTIQGETNVNLVQPTCSDSDSGKTYSVKGNVKYCNDKAECSSKEDSCSGKKLIEWYCQNNERHSEEHECESDCDEGACVNLVNKYTYPYSSGGGGGGSGGSSSGGGGTPAVVNTGQTYSIGELSSENTLDIVRYDSIKFTISGTEHLINLQDNTNTLATISVDGITYPFNIGEEKRIDLNSDGNPELYIKLRSINTLNGKVTLTLNLVS